MTLTELDISHNNLGQRTGAAIVHALKNRNCLQKLRAGFNPLGREATALIIESMKKNALPALGLENTTVKKSYSNIPRIVDGGKEETLFGEAWNKHGDGNSLKDVDEDDVQYVWELAERTKRSKNVLLMIRTRKKVKLVIDVEWPPTDRKMRNQLLKTVMTWLKGATSNESDTGSDAKKKKRKDGNGDDGMVTTMRISMAKENQFSTHALLRVNRIPSGTLRKFWEQHLKMTGRSSTITPL